MSKEYVRNHFVPEGYLKGFNNQNAKVFRLKLNPKKFPSGNFEKSIIEKPPSCFCYKDDLYTIFDKYISKRIPDNYPDENKYIEKECFKDIENKIGNVIESIENGHITNYKKSILVDFICTSIRRNLKVIEDFKNTFTEEFIDETLNTLPRKEKKRVKRMIKNDKRFERENIGKIIIQRNILSIHSNSDERKKIFDLNKTRRFTIYKAIGDVEFITSNYPAFFEEDNLGNSGMFRLSFFLPLNKKNLLIIDGGPSDNSICFRDTNSPHVDLLNYLILKNSNGEIYGCCKETLKRYENRDFQNMLKLWFRRMSRL